MVSVRVTVHKEDGGTGPIKEAHARPGSLYLLRDFLLPPAEGISSLSFLKTVLYFCPGVSCSEQKPAQSVVKSVKHDPHIEQKFNLPLTL